MVLALEFIKINEGVHDDYCYRLNDGYLGKTNFLKKKPDKLIQSLKYVSFNKVFIFIRIETQADLFQINSSNKLA
jgi:hypothetical protein